MVKHLKFDDPEFVPVDNCYAESVAPNPHKNKNKETKDSGT